MTEFDGVISQAPLGKGRPRAVNAGKHARVYTPPATAQWEFFAANELRTAWGDVSPLSGALACEIVADRKSVV